MEHPVKKINIQKTCVVTPFLTQGLAQALNISTIQRQDHLKYGQSDGVTLIETRIGAPYVTDTVLNLKNTACTLVVFTGSAGATQDSNLSIGSIVTVEKSYHNEILPHLIKSGIQTQPAGYSDKQIQAQLQEQFPSIRAVTAASVASLALEHTLDVSAVDVLDMESASFFSAAESIYLPAAAILYVSDIIGTTSPFLDSEFFLDTSIQQMIAKMIHAVSQPINDEV